MLHALWIGVSEQFLPPLEVVNFVAIGLGIRWLWVRVRGFRRGRDGDCHDFFNFH